MASYIPAKQGDFAAWALNFTTRVVATPAAFGLTAAQAADLSAAHSVWVAAYAAATNPGTRTQAAVAAKDAARVAFEAVARPLAMIARAYLLAIPDGGGYDQLELLGLHIPDPTPTPIPAPTTFPVIELLGTLNGALTLSLADSASPNARRRPPGAVGCELWVHAGDAPVDDVSDAVFRGLVTRVPHTLSYGAEWQGKVASLFGRWITGRGLVGPWSAAAVCILS